MDWKQTRHVILTVGRSKPPQVYDMIMKWKAIPMLIRTLKLTGNQWIWILEFHSDGYPHWHLLIESPGGMIGHRAISEAWTWGHVWESYIKSEQHWGAIVGYHRAKGYLAGEGKGHQLVLPPWLKDRSRVRKFGASIERKATADPRENVPRGTLHKKHREPDRTYADRETSCGQGCRIACAGQWIEAPTAYPDAVRAAGSRLQTRGKGRFEGEAPAVIATANLIVTGCRAGK